MLVASGMREESAAPPETSSSAPIAAPVLRELQQRSDRAGWLRLVGHVAAIGTTAWLYGFALARGPWPVTGLAAIAYGFTLVTMFAAMHECVHRTAFKSTYFNDGVGWFAGLLSFYNSTFYRHYHGWHHRFTQLPGKDPELDDGKPTDLPSYLVELSGVTWWIGKLRTHLRLAAGETAVYPYLNEGNRRAVVRSVRAQLGLYALALAVAAPLFVLFWLLPVALAQPLLRAILLAEHTGCSEDGDPLTNTRTTHTVLPIRFLMWNMPFHAEHHRYPALPFFALASAHASMEPRLTHVARSGYLGVHTEFLRTLSKRPPPIERPV